MTGYKSKKAAAIAKTIDEVNWADHEPNGITQPAQEPVAYLCKPDQHGLFDIPTPDKACTDCFPVYAAPPQRPWVGLTEEELRDIAGYGPDYFDWKVFGKAIEAKLKDKNT